MNESNTSQTAAKTVHIESLAEIKDGVQAPSAGFEKIPFLRQETSKAARPAIFVNAQSKEPQLQAQHSATGLIGERSFSILKDVVVASHSLPFYQRHLLIDDSVPSKVSIGFAERDGIFSGKLDLLDPIKVDADLLVIAGPGYPIWGHWLLDFLPRLLFAQSFFGADLAMYKIPMPSDSPRWVLKMINFFTGLTDNSLVFFDIDKQVVATSGNTVIPDFLHRDYFLHSQIAHYYQRFSPSTPATLPGKICVSRKKFKDGRSVAREFPRREYFEEIASRRGYAIVHPELLSFREQIDLFANASAIVGEYGSGMHNTLFSRENTIVGQFIMPSTIQSRIAGLMDHRSAFLIPDNDPRFDTPEVAIMNVSDEKIVEFFDAMDALHH